MVPENIQTTPREGICRMTPPPLLIFQKSAPKIHPAPFPFRISKIFTHPVEMQIMTFWSFEDQYMQKKYFDRSALL